VVKTISSQFSNGQSQVNFSIWKINHPAVLSKNNGSWLIKLHNLINNPSNPRA